SCGPKACVSCARTVDDSLFGSLNPPPDRWPKTPAPQTTPATTSSAPAARMPHRARTTKCPHLVNMALPRRLDEAASVNTVHYANTVHIGQARDGGDACDAGPEPARPAAREHRGRHQAGSPRAARLRRTVGDLAARDRPYPRHVGRRPVPVLPE